MTFTFAEWKMIEQAVRNWKENCEERMNNSEPSNAETSMYQIFKQQTIELTNLHKKIMNKEI